MENKQKAPQSKLVSFGYDLVAGGSSGIIAKTISAPIERVKLLLQTQSINENVAVKYKGPINCLVRIYKEEGILAYWRGNLANVYRYFPAQAISFAFKDQYKKYFVGAKTGNAGTDKWNVVFGSLVSGGLAGGSATIVSYPFEVARTRLAVDMGSGSKPVKILNLNLVTGTAASATAAAEATATATSTATATATSTVRQYTGTFDCLRVTYRTEGIRGVYAGLAISLAGSILFRGLFMGGYDVVKYLYDLEHSSVATRLIAAHGVTTLTGTLCYPIDTVKRRMMVQKGNVIGADALATTPEAAVYRNSWDCFRKILRTEGYRGLFHGLSVNLVRGMSGAFLLVGYDEIKKVFSKL